MSNRALYLLAIVLSTSAAFLIAVILKLTVAVAISPVLGLLLAAIAGVVAIFVARLVLGGGQGADQAPAEKQLPSRGLRRRRSFLSLSDGFWFLLGSIVSLWSTEIRALVDGIFR